MLGTYTATISDPGTGDTATASTTVSAAPEAPAPAPTDELQCDPPRSQLESEQCAELEGVAPEPLPPPEEQLPVCDPVAPVEPCRDG